jgi:hypothetical protein
MDDEKLNNPRARAPFKKSSKIPRVKTTLILSQAAMTGQNPTQKTRMMCEKPI